MVAGSFLFGVILYLAFATLGAKVQTRFRQAVQLKSVQQRTLNTTPRMFMQLLEKYPMGKGIGSASQAARHLGKLQGQFDLVENYPSKLLVETGVIGAILFYTLMCFLISRWSSWASEFYEESPGHLFFIAISAYFAGCLISGVFPDTPPASLFFWGSVGILPRIAAVERHRRQNSESTFPEN